MANRSFTRSFYTPHAMPVLVDCNFNVLSTSVDGLGISNLKGPGVANVYMRAAQAAITATSVFASGDTVLTLSSVAGLRVGAVVTDSTTAGNITAGTVITAISGSTITISQVAAGSSAVSPGDTLSFANPVAIGSPAPVAGIIAIRLQDNYNGYFSGFAQMQSPVTGSAINISSSSVLTVGTPYQIVTLGTSTQANWEAVGVPHGAAAAVGQVFLASVTGSGTGTGTVKALSSSAIDHIEVLGNSSLNLGPVGFTSGANNQGGWIFLKCLLNTTITAPADGTVVSLGLYLSNSSVQVQGE